VTGIDRIEASVVRRGQELAVYRVYRGDPTVASFMSSFSRRRPPRGWESRNVLIQMGLSTFLRLDGAEAVATRFPVIGDHVACLVLRHGCGFAFAHTGPRGHVTIWGRPLQLLAAVIETTPIEF
jgi:hypothetical protein